MVKKEKWSISKENTVRGKLVRAILKFLVYPVFNLIWLKKLTGKQNIPAKGPFILAANHQSYLDFILLCGVSSRHLRFLAAEKFYHSSFWRPIMEYTGQIRVDRHKKGNKEEVFQRGLEVLEKGEALAIFPQGTRSRNGKIEKTYTGVAKFALKAGVPVVPVGIKGAFTAWPPEKKPKFKKIVSIHIGEPIKFNNYRKDQYQDPKILREVTNQIMLQISQLSGKSYEEE